MTKTSLRNILLLLALGFCWGPSFLFIRLALEEIPPFTLVTMRLAPGALLLWLVIFATKQPILSYLREWRHFVVMGFLACAFPFCCISAGEQFISSSLAAIVNSTTPLFTALAAHFFINERLTLNKILGICCGFVGILAVFIPALLNHSNNNEFGIFLVLLAAMSYAGGFLYSRKFVAHVPSLLGAAFQVSAACLLVTPLSFLLEKPLSMPMPSTKALMGIMGLAFLGTALAFVIYYKLTKEAGATYASTSTLLFPAIAVILGVVILKEELTLNILIGCPIIFIGLAIANNIIKLNFKRPSHDYT
jgi:drug/metabolite transporter (DMT)-like permease